MHYTAPVRVEQTEAYSDKASQQKDIKHALSLNRNFKE
jgi:hypothetical protein